MALSLPRPPRRVALIATPAGIVSSNDFIDVAGVGEYAAAQVDVRSRRLRGDDGLGLSAILVFPTKPTRVISPLGPIVTAAGMALYPPM